MIGNVNLIKTIYIPNMMLVKAQSTNHVFDNDTFRVSGNVVISFVYKKSEFDCFILLFFYIFKLFCFVLMMLKINFIF